MFDIPIAIITFKRVDKTVQIVNQIKKVQPRKLYILSDQGRTEEEIELVNKCRNAVEECIDWDCEVVKRYAEKNIGVFNNIGNGARWVFEREPVAIFLEDDNFPELSFFSYCKQMLEKYYEDDRILWVCGTNYLGKYRPKDGSDILFSQQLFPCGWASWSHKFLKYYDGELQALKNDPCAWDSIHSRYKNEALYIQQKDSITREFIRIQNEMLPRSWDFQMIFSLKYYNKLGILPKYNQIRNIGDDAFSEHGGTSLKLPMTRRFCQIPTYMMPERIKTPAFVEEEDCYRKKAEHIILLPWKSRAKSKMNTLIKKMLHIPNNVPIREAMFNRGKRG